MTDKPSKILCCGDVNGNFLQLVKKVSAINRKNGPFDMLICVGEFFGPDEALNEKIVSGELEFPVPTYILGPCSPSTSAYYPDDATEFSSSVTFLGKRGILNTATGLQIAYLSGIEGVTLNACQFNIDDVQELLVPIKTQSGFLGVDILLTSMWPAEVSKHAHNTPSSDIEGSTLISRLAAGLKPRYHFAGMGIHYERQPYRNHRVLIEPAQHPTRFIGLAPLANTTKQKALYAFNLAPMKKMKREELTLQPPNVSEFPYMELLTEILTKEAESAAASERSANNAHFRFDMSGEAEEDNGDGRNRKRRGRGEGPQEDKRPAAPCWFCLSNMDAEKHLVVSVGESCYAAMPKGPLVDDHVMVLSIGHIQSLVAAPPAVREEVKKYKEAFTLVADKAGKALVCFERNFRCQHLQVQMVPVPKESVKALRGAFFNTASLSGVELSAVDEEHQLEDLVNEGCPYFFAELPDGTRLFTREMKRFPLQFGREVLASTPILDCEAKIDWRSAVLSKDEETKLALKLKERFAPFDFTDDGDSD